LATVAIIFVVIYCSLRQSIDSCNNGTICSEKKSGADARGEEKFVDS
jgi:hypothetical protein